MSKPHLIGIGELLWDMLPTGKQPGGAPANFACHVQALGGSGIIVSAVGKDALGQEIIERLKACSVDCTHIGVETKYPTGTVSIDLDSEGNATYHIRELVAWDFIRETPQLTRLAKKADAVIFGTLAQRSEISRKTIQNLTRQMRPTAWCILDINLRPPFYNRKTIESSLSLAHILKLNDEELVILAETLSLKGEKSAILAQLLKRYKLALIALTKGKNGSILYSENEVSIHPGYKIEVADTVGAGDAFTAVLALGMLKGQSLDVINDNANRLAAYVCSKAGAVPHLSPEIRAMRKDR